ncbi:MAG TPA: hypothetical protein PLB88_02285, partial [Thermoanaerobaculaceae bacterium]|nr:hypothetical protein [Thermoanaerobaculaceae bacterium]
RLKRSALYLGILALFSFFGVIHSSSPDGNMYLPWTLASSLQRAIPYQFTLAYLVLAAMFLLLSLSRESREAPPEDLEHPGVGV